MLLAALQLLYVFSISLTHEIGLLSKFSADGCEWHLLIVAAVLRAQILLSAKAYLLDDAVDFLVIEMAFSLQDLGLARVLLGL